MNPTPIITPFEQKLYKKCINFALKNMDDLLVSIREYSRSNSDFISLVDFPLIHAHSRIYCLQYDFQTQKFTKFKISALQFKNHAPDHVMLYEFDVPLELNKLLIQ